LELKNFFVQDDHGEVLPGATCYLYQRGTETIVSGLIQANGAGLMNPFVAGDDGLVQLAAANGLYDLRVVTATRDYRIRVQFNDVNDDLAAAKASAERAEQARDATLLIAGSYGVFDTLELLNAPVNLVAEPGQSATVISDPVAGNNGAYYKIGTSGIGSWKRQQNQPTTEQELESRVIKFKPQQSLIPLARTESAQVAIWLEDGDFGARDLTAKLRAKVVRDVITAHNSTPNYFPLMRTGQGQVPLWWQYDGFNVASVSQSFVKKILAKDTRLIPPAESGPLATAPVYTDGRNNHNWRAAAARVRMAVSGAKAKIGVVGDSWAQNPAIPRAIRTWLSQSPLGVMSNEETWRPAITTETYFASSVAHTGWTLLDGSVTTVFPYGAGVDGHNIYTTGTTATLAMANATGTRIRIYHSKVPGAWRYRIDGGAWVPVVTNGAAQELGVIDLTGLSNTAHTLDIDTTNNTGVAAIHGFSITNTLPGYEVVKMGNGGLTGKMMKGFIPYMQPVASDFPINLLLVILGTNDYRTVDATPMEYTEALTQLTAAWRAINPDIGIVFIAPPQSNGVAVVPLATYRDAMYKFALANGCDFLNMLDVFGTYAQTSSAGQWNDALHLSDAGATNLAYQFAKAFL
jgi:hypothetical protein